MYHTPRGKRFFLPWITFHLWFGERGFSIKELFGEEKLFFFGFLLDVSLPRRRCACLSKPEGCHCSLLWLVWGRFRGSICDCLWLASGAIV